jgi:hypothetical protein
LYVWGIRLILHALKSSDSPFKINIAPKNTRIASALLNGSVNKNIPLPKVISAVRKKIHPHTADRERVPIDPNNCRKPRIIKIIPRKTTKILTITEGDAINTIPNNMVVIPWADQNPFIDPALFLFDKINVTKPLNTSITPMIIITVCMVNPGTKSNIPPNIMVRIPRNKEFLEFGTKNLIIIS